MRGSSRAPGPCCGVPRHDSHKEEDPPETDEPSTDAGEEAADHENRMIAPMSVLRMPSTPPPPSAAPTSHDEIRRCV